MPRTGGVGKVRAVVALQEHHNRFLQDLVDAVRARTGIAVSRSDVLRALVETAMGLKLSESDIDEAYITAHGLNTLRKSRDEIRSEIRDTETDLQLTLIDNPEDAASLRLFRRNLAYQMRRLAAVEVQISQWEQSRDGEGNGVARLLYGFLFCRICMD